jgi:hypothetical protein
MDKIRVGVAFWNQEQRFTPTPMPTPTFPNILPIPPFGIRGDS